MLKQWKQLPTSRQKHFGPKRGQWLGMGTATQKWHNSSHKGTQTGFEPMQVSEQAIEMNHSEHSNRVFSSCINHFKLAMKFYRSLLTTKIKIMISKEEEICLYDMNLSQGIAIVTNTAKYLMKPLRTWAGRSYVQMF